MEKLKRLPIGVQDFKKIIEGGYLYIDKTKHIYDLITTTDYVFFSRPRRFGKSLLVSTLKYLFQGEKELFEGLDIYDKYDFKKHPVIHISFAGDMRSPEALITTILSILRSNERLLDIKCIDSDNYAICFRELIENAHEKYKQKVVVLIDEYDKPILDNIDQMEVAKENREILRGLYSIMKDMDSHIRFAFLTGVSKFSKAGIFSGLNNLEDISLDSDYGNLAGITQSELDEYLGEYLRENSVDLDEVKEWYNGYNFFGDLVYNPFDLLLFIRNKFTFKNYWFSSGTPKFLIDVIDKGNFYIPRLSGIEVDEAILNSFDIDNIRPEIVLFQAGYLTIDKQIERPRGGWEYLLKLPNKEVRMSLSDVLLEYIEGSREDRVKHQNRITELIDAGDMEGLKNEIEALFASMPYHYHTHGRISEYEGYYASVIYSYLQSTGYQTIAEDVSNRGRADLTMIMKDRIYIFEIKVDSSEEPIKQIKERQYYKKYQAQGKPIYMVGINIDSEKKNIDGFEWEKI